MRCHCLLVALLSLLVWAAGQDTNDAAIVTLVANGGSDDNLNLDPVLAETIDGTGASTSGAGQPEEQLVDCTTEDGGDGVCVKYYLCDQESKTIIEDGYSIIDIRAGSSCAKFLDVCCRRSQVANDDKAESKKKESLPTTASTATAEFTADKAVDSSPSLGVGPVDSGRAIGKCGTSNRGANVFRIRDMGSPDDKVYADFGEYPWMVAILKRQLSEDKWDSATYIGGGTLIHPSVVMTVAHKVTSRKPEDIKIRAGEWDSNTNDEQYDYQERDVTKIVVHQNYFRESLYNDVALLFLQSAVLINDEYPNIGVACLGRQLPPPDTQCFSMGWGRDDFKNKNVFAAILKKVKLPLLDSNVCETMLQKTRLGRLFKLHSSLVCAGGQGADTCKGDGGSSLVCPINGGNTRYAVYGMVAYGIQCWTKQIPGVYVNVPTVLQWVTQQVAAEGLDTSVFLNY